MSTLAVLNKDMTTNTDSIEYLDTIPSFWDDADRIIVWLEAHPGLHNRSTIKRRAKVAGDVQHILSYLERHSEVRADGNGAWRKYGTRR
jgi:hypothetical protein